MSDGFDVDLSKLGKRLPGAARRLARGAGKAAVTTAGVAETVANPGDLLAPAGTKVIYRGTARRLRGCTIATRAHLLGMADLPDLDEQGSIQLSVVLLRLRVERPDGDAETCVRQHVPGALRRLALGSSVRALAHEEDPRIAVIDWKTTGERLGIALDYTLAIEQYAWPDPEEWPAAGAIEVRDTWRHRRRLEKRRAEWRLETARLVGAAIGGGRVDKRDRWKLDLEVAGRVVNTKERVPGLALARLVRQKPPKQRLGGLITSTGIEAVTGAPIAVLVSPSGELEVDWEATLAQPEMRESVEL